MRDRQEQRVGFFPAFMNLPETSRLVQIAERYRKMGGEVVFFSHGGAYEPLAGSSDLPIIRVEPIYTPEQIEELLKYDRLEKFGDPFPVPWLRQHVLNEERAFRASSAALIVTGFNVPCSLSARKAGIPLVWIIPGTALPCYFRAGLATFPDTFENALTRLLPARLKSWATNRLMLRSKVGTRAFNQVAREFGLPSLPNVLSLWMGDYTLASDLREALEVPVEYDLPAQDYIGPLLADLGLALEPELIAHLSRPGPNIYFSLGSSGQRSLYLEILEILSRTDYNVVAAYTTILAADELPHVGRNILLRKFVPAESLNRMVDLAVLHGGQGTFYTAAYARRPVVGIPSSGAGQRRSPGVCPQSMARNEARAESGKSSSTSSKPGSESCQSSISICPEILGLPPPRSYLVDGSTPSAIIASISAPVNASLSCRSRWAWSGHSKPASDG